MERRVPERNRQSRVREVGGATLPQSERQPASRTRLCPLGRRPRTEQ